MGGEAIKRETIEADSKKHGSIPNYKCAASSVSFLLVHVLCNTVLGDSGGSGVSI